MITRVIHDTFELDLSNKETTHIEENNWINDKVQSKYIYPVELELTPEQIIAFKNIIDYNLKEFTTLFEVEFYTMGEQHDAVMEIVQLIGKSAKIEIRYGLEEFPNYDKPLSQLPLEKIELIQSIYNYAETIITQSYPAVNFNFPQVITDKLDVESEQWQFFEGIVNNYANGDFLINEYDSVNDEQINRNVIQPLPYLLHIIKSGFEDLGYTLEGDILEDPYFKKATIYALSEFYTKFNTAQQLASLNSDEYDTINNNNKGSYSSTITFTDPGRYKIAGNVIIRSKPGISNPSNASFEYDGNTVWSGIGFNLVGYKEKLFSVDFNIDYTGSEGTLSFLSEQLSYAILQGDIISDAIILDITVTQLARLDVQGNFISTLIEPDLIDLSKCVPDLNFGPFVTAFTKWRNYGIDLNGSVVTISKKKKLIDAIDTSFNLAPFEVEFPEINFTQGDSYTMSFFDVDSNEYTFQKILITKDGYQLSPFSKPDDANEIIIEALPLPLKQFGSVKTAHGFLDDNSKPQVVLYNGLTDGINLAQSPEDLSILNVYLNDHQSWFEFLLNKAQYNWSFSSYYETIIDLKIKSIIYAYKQYQIIRRLTRKTKSDNKVDVEIETQALE